jgi:hypothetical protein
MGNTIQNGRNNDDQKNSADRRERKRSGLKRFAAAVLRSNKNRAKKKSARVVRAYIRQKLYKKRSLGPEDKNQSSYSKKRRQEKLAELLLSKTRFDLFMTVNSNDPRLTYGRGRIALRKLDAIMDRYFLGKRWCRFPSEQRTFFIAVPERGADGDLHYHLLVRIPPKLKTVSEKLKTVHRCINKRNLQRKKIFPRGDVHTRMLKRNDLSAQVSVACYVVKRLWREESWANWMLSTELH